jgi:hypothetical protein
VRLERHSEEQPVRMISPERQREAREGAHRWLARFAPLLDVPAGLSAADCRRRLELATELRGTSAPVLTALEGQAGAADAELLTTLREAAGQLDGVEGDLRERLGLLAPGDPAGIVDLTKIRARLAERAARSELEEVVPSATGVRELRLEADTSSGNVAGAIMLGIFAFGWLSFTTVHACFMIGGMAAAFGWMALGLLGFYAIFFAAGFAMAWGAIKTASKERIALDGRQFTLTRHFGLWTWQNTYEMGPNSRAYVVEPSMRQEGSTAKEIAVRTAEGKEVRFANGLAHYEQERLIERLNEYLQAHSP